MSTMELLYVEDAQSDIEACKGAVSMYNDSHDHKINLTVARSFSETMEKMRTSFDCAIIDLILQDDFDGGRKIIAEIQKHNVRIPIIAFTGTPDVEESLSNLFNMGIKIKGQDRLVDIFDDFWNVYNTGITKIMGGRGEIEQSLFRFFLTFINKRERWIIYGSHDSVKTEKILLRHAINHLLLLIDNDIEFCYPEEVYISNLSNDDSNVYLNKIHTGSILKNADNFFIILTPSCDLVLRPRKRSNSSEDKKFDADYILLAEIESLAIIEQRENLNSDSKKSLKKNEKSGYHYLPSTSDFNGGYINFRKLTSIDIIGQSHNIYEHLKRQGYNLVGIMISPFFIKNIISRFSSCYARQGQPDIQHEIA